MAETVASTESANVDCEDLRSALEEFSDLAARFRAGSQGCDPAGR